MICLCRNASLFGKMSRDDNVLLSIRPYVIKCLQSRWASSCCTENQKNKPKQNSRLQTVGVPCHYEGATVMVAGICRTLATF